MAIETLKENLCVNQVVGKSQETISVDDDVIIPDIKPDILSVVDTSGTICIYKKEVLDGRIKIEGGIQVYIMYIADDENSNVRGISTVIDFSKVIEMENVNSNMVLDNKISLKNIDCKILNGRKINISANIGVEVSVFNNENIEFVSGIENNEDIQVLNTAMSVNSLVGSGCTKVYAKDTLMLDSNDNLMEIVKCNISFSNKELKTSYNKVLIKSDMNVNLLYLTEENRLNEVNGKIPVMGFIDMQNISDENIFNINYEIKNILIKPNNVEEHSVFVEIEIEIACNSYENKELDIIQDLYSPTESLKINQKDITIMQGKNQYNEVVSVNENMQIPELKNCKVCTTSVVPKITKKDVYNNKINYEGELQIQFIYISENSNTVDSKIQTVPFNTSINAGYIGKNTNIDEELNVISSNIAKNSDNGNIEINVDMQVTADVFQMTSIKVIDNLENDEQSDENIYSIVVYFVKPGDTLWQIAKKFRSTINAIASVNGIENENELNIGQQLFIPKFVA